jgi:hypothetical protein
MRHEMSTTRRGSHRMSTKDSATTARSVGLRLLLVVVGIQGITPDPNDLASSRAFQVLLSESQSSGHWQHEDDGNGEVSRPIRTESDSMARQRVEQTRDVDFASIGSMPDALMSKIRGIAGPPGGLMGPDQLIHLLCHLMC